MRKLPRVFFEDRLRGLGRWRVKKNDCCHVFTERLRDAGELLRQHPHTDAGVARREAEFHQLSGPPFHVFRGGAVIKNDERVRAFENKTGQLQPCFDTVLFADEQQVTSKTSATKQKNPKRVAAGKAVAERTRIAREAQRKAVIEAQSIIAQAKPPADDHIQPRVSLAKPVQRSVVGEGRADQHNVIKLASEWTVELVHEKLGLARVGRANNQRVEWNISGVHFNTAQKIAVYFEC